MEYTFEASAWEQTVEALAAGAVLSGAQALTLLESEDIQTAQELLQQLDEKGITLDVSQLPPSRSGAQMTQRLALEAKLCREGDLLRDLEETDPLRLYLEELAGTPVCGDAKLLAQRYAVGEDSAAQMLTGLLLSAVVAQAKKLAGQGVLLVDLIQEGSLGLWQSIITYESGEFEPRALWFARQYMARALVLQAKENGLGARLLTAMEDYRSVDERLLGELGRNPTLDELAEALHMSREETAAVADMLENTRTMSRLKAPEPEEQEEDRAVEDTAYFQLRQRIAELLDALSEQEAKLLTLRFGLEGSLPMKPDQAARKLGLTEQEALTMEAAALAKLRNQA